MIAQVSKFVCFDTERAAGSDATRVVPMQKEMLWWEGEQGRDEGEDSSGEGVKRDVLNVGENEGDEGNAKGGDGSQDDEKYGE